MSYFASVNISVNAFDLSLSEKERTYCLLKNYLLLGKGN